MHIIKSDNGKRYSTECILNTNDISIIDAIMDTGAVMSCINVESLGEKLNESMFYNGEYKYVHGLVNSDSAIVKFYAYEINQFTIGRVNLGKCKVWITFDKAVKDNIIGMDLLKKVNMLQIANEDRLYIFKSKCDLIKYINGGDMERTVYRNNGRNYVIIDNLECYFSSNNVHKDNKGRYIKLNNIKCYLKEKGRNKY